MNLGYNHIMDTKPQPYENVAQKQAMHRIMTNNFIAGIFWAMGVTIGFSLLIAILSLISHYINFVPIVGKFTSEVIDFVLSYNHRF